MAAPSQGTQDTRSTSYGGAKQSVADDVDALRSDIASLANSVKKLATEKFGATASEALHQGEQKIGEFESAIRRNPTQSALIAVGIGFVVGLILTR